MSITVTPGPNDLPVALPDNYVLQEDATLQVGSVGGVLANDSDPEGANLSAVVEVAPMYGTALATGGRRFHLHTTGQLQRPTTALSPTRSTVWSRASRGWTFTRVSAARFVSKASSSGC